MFALSDNAVTILLQWLGAVGSPTRPSAFYAGLHSGYAGQNGASLELSGNGYARTVLTPQVSGRTLSNTGAINFPAATGSPWSEALFASLWDASSAGNCIFTSPLASGIARVGVSDDITTDKIMMDAHGFSNTDRVFVQQIGSNAFPAGLTKNTIYFVVSATTNDFKLSATSGGSAIDITAIGSLTVQKITNARTAGVGDVVQFAAGVLSFQLPAAG